MSLADKFIAELENQELSPPISGSSIIFQESGWNTEMWFKKYYDEKMPFPLLINVNKDRGIFYIPISRTKILNEEIFMKYLQKPSLLKEIESKYLKMASSIDEFYKKLTPDYFSKNKLSLIRKDLQKMRDIVWEMNGLLFFTIYLDEEMVRKYISTLGLRINSFDYFWEKASLPMFDSFETRHSLEVIDLLENGNNWEEILKQCQYFKSSYAEISESEKVKKELEEEYHKFLDSKERRLFLDKAGKKKEENLLQMNKFYGNLNELEKRIAYFVQKNIELRDIRKDYILKFLAAVSRFSESLKKETGISLDLLLFCTLDELMRGSKFLLNHKNELEKRRNGYSVLVSYDGKRQVEYGNFLKNHELVEEYFLRNLKDENMKSIKGHIGAPGKISGKVRVIIDMNKGNDFKDGEILVTGMTRPEFVPLMKKASAIITDEGGVTCHAAIVARELKKPCIIGTKIATQVLKDGDSVEVDADNGIVRILRKA